METYVDGGDEGVGRGVGVVEKQSIHLNGPVRL